MHSWNTTPQPVVQRWVIQSPEEIISVTTSGLLENERTSSVTVCSSPGSAAAEFFGARPSSDSVKSSSGNDWSWRKAASARWVRGDEKQEGWCSGLAQGTAAAWAVL